VPHASNNRRLVTTKGTALCVTCHGEILRDVKAVKSSHLPAREDCVACHDPHGSLVKPILKKGEKDLCLGCHADLSNILKNAKAKKHVPAAEGQCAKCHRPHDADQPDLLKAAAPGLCTTCHAPDTQKIRAAHGGIPVAKSDCVACHEPHGSLSGTLIQPVEHKPFAGKICTACHK
jgi:predicted CXXCH cytochrome family protein